MTLLAKNQNPMSDTPGDEFRKAFLVMLEKMGTDCDAGGELRKALIQENKEKGYTVFKFADEFPLKAGDMIRNCMTETIFSVIDTPHAVSRANAFHHFEAAAV